METGDELRGEIVKRLEHVCDEIFELNFDRHIWQCTARIADANPYLVEHSFYPAWIGAQFYRRAATAIRALTDHAPGRFESMTDSLVTVLRQVAANAGNLSVFPFVLDLLTDEGRIDADVVQTDIDRLTRVATVTKKYVDKYLAHLDRDPAVAIPTGQHVDDAIDLINELAKRYYLVLTGAGYDLQPKILFDWSASLNVAWKQPDDQ